MAEALLAVSNVETYYGPIMALRGVSFSVPAGAIVTILGANGAGKTTILKTVSGVMDPQKGSVTLDPPGGIYLAGTQVTLTAVPAAGYVFQGWSGALSGAANPALLLMNGNKSATATFRRQ